jgi:spore germination protein KB
MQIVKGSIFPFSFLGQSILLLVLNRFIKEPKKSGFGVIWGLIFSIFFLLISTFLVISTFGPGLSNKMYFPFYEVVRFTSVAEFVQNVEVFLVLAWILCVFVKLSLFLFVSSYSTAQLINMKSWKKAIWFVALITMVISLWFQNFNTATIEFPKKYIIPYLVPLNYVIIPMLLLIVGLIKRKNKEKPKER